jgi:hypothetical protein
MSVLMQSPRTAAAERFIHRPGAWSQPIRAEIRADFGLHGVERQLADLRPWGPTGVVTVNCCSTCGQYSAQTLPRDPDPQLPTWQQALQMLGHFFFGRDALAPRIVGPIDWLTASLSLRYADDDDHPAMLRLQLKPHVEGQSRAMASCRQELDGANKAFLLYLRPADADPLYALMRVGLGVDVDMGFSAS